jgi:hypothetical protein
MRTTIASLLVAAGVVSIVSSPGAASADTVPFASLPQAQSHAKSVSASSANGPEKIAAGERVEGIYPAILPEAKRKTAESDGYRTVQVFTSEREAQAYATEGTLPSSTAREPSSTRSCLTRSSVLAPRVAFYYRVKPYTQPKLTPAQIKLLMMEHRWPPPAVKPEPQKDTVDFVRLEKTTQSGDSLTVETVDAFIDLQTMGTHLVSKTSEKLAKVASGPNGLGVYAARADETHSEFLVTNPELPQPKSDDERQAQLQALQSTASRLVAQLPSGTTSSQGCGYVRFDLAAKPGTGQMATVLAMAFLPPARDLDAPPPDENTGTENDELSKVQAAFLARANRAQRARPVAVNVSVSQLASEQSPLLSVTFGWAGKDQRLAF